MKKDTPRVLEKSLLFSLHHRHNLLLTFCRYIRFTLCFPIYWCLQYKPSKNISLLTSVTYSPTKSTDKPTRLKLLFETKNTHRITSTPSEGFDNSNGTAFMSRIDTVLKLMTVCELTYMFSQLIIGLTLI